MYVQRGWSNNKKTYSQISNQVNILVDACYNIVKSKNLSIKICQEINKSGFSFSISIDANKKRKKKSPSQKKREEKRRKDWIKKKKMPTNNKPLMTAKPVTNVRALQLFQQTLTSRWLTTLPQILIRHQQLTTAKPATNARAL